MNNKIIYEGQEYKDKFMTTTNYSPSLWMRIEFLFCANTIFETETYCKEIMPAERTITTFHIIPVWKRIRNWYQGKRGYGQMQSLASSPDDFWVECVVCKQRLKNWTGSTPCCGSIALLVDAEGNVSDKTMLFASVNGGEIKPMEIKIKKDEH